MAIKLPPLTTEVDCGSLGYDGLTVTFWLNPPRLDWIPPDERKPPQAVKDLEPWDRLYYHILGRVFLRVYFPEMQGEPEQTIELGTAKTLYGLEREPGFDPQIITYAFNTYGETRDKRVAAELGN